MTFFPFGNVSFLKARHNARMRRHTNILLTALCLFLASCGGNYGCVEADDWGYPKVFLSMDYGDLTDNGQLVMTPGNDYVQYMTPVDSGQVLLGGDVVIRLDRAHNQWSPFLGKWLNPMFGDGGEERMLEGWWPEKLIPNRECRYFDFQPGQNYNHLDEVYYDESVPFDQQTIALQKQTLMECKRDSETPGDFVGSDFYGDCLAPCFVRHGVGLFMGVIPDKKTLSDLGTVEPEDVVIRHLTDFDTDGQINAAPDGTDNRDLDNYLVNGPIEGAERNGRLYFKISDVYYQDDIGGYRVHVKCGTKPDKKGPFELLTGMVSSVALAVAEALYRTMTGSNVFVDLVRTALMLSIVFYGFGFIIGTTSIKLKDTALYILKIGVIMMLISDQSWEFFYSHLFVLFIESVDYLGSLFLGGSEKLNLGCDIFDETVPWQRADVMFRIMTSDETWRKVASTLFSNVWGFLFVITFIVGFFVFVLGVVKLLIVYISGFIGLTILIILFPLFLLLYLFKWTEKYFSNEWVDQIVANASELIFSIALLGFLFQILLTMLQNSVGYRVCWKSIWEFPSATPVVSLGFFMPDITSLKEERDWDGDGTVDGERYADLPYFDLERDADKISRYMRGHDFIDIGDVVVLLGVILLLRFLNDFIMTVANLLKDNERIKDGSASILGPAGSFMASAGKPVFGVPAKGGTRQGGLIGFKSSPTQALLSGNMPRLGVQKGGILDNNALAWTKKVAGEKNWNTVTAPGRYASEKWKKKGVDSKTKDFDRTSSQMDDSLDKAKENEAARGDGTLDSLTRDRLLLDSDRLLARGRDLSEKMASTRGKKFDGINVRGKKDPITKRPITLGELDSAKKQYQKQLKDVYKQRESGPLSDAQLEALRDAELKYSVAVERFRNMKNGR
jgi:hypothetical protein